MTVVYNWEDSDLSPSDLTGFDRFLGDILEKEMAIHSSTISWKIPWTEEPGRLQSTGLQRVGHDWATSLSLWRNLLVSKKVERFEGFN